MAELKGRRVYPRADGELWLAEGDYGKDSRGVWMARPFGPIGSGSLEGHEVEEHADGTITVTPSIEISDGTISWHGFLERGVWRIA